MKSILSLFAIAMVSLVTFGQVTEGKINYSMDFSSSQPEVQGQLSMLKGSTMELFFAPEGSSLSIAMGMFITTTTIYNVKERKTLTLMSGMIGKKAMIKESTGNETPEDMPEIVKSSETKTILGYKCSKYFIDLGPEAGIMTYWTTEDLVITHIPENKFILPGVKGMPLEFTIESPQINIDFKATEIVKHLKKENKKELFSTAIPEGYELATLEELESMGGM